LFTLGARSDFEMVRIRPTSPSRLMKKILGEGP
jgi:hypothetical protein